MSNADVRIVQTCYPQIYLACHTRHRRAASSANGLSARDSSLLAHLDERQATTPTELAIHLGVGKSTMSAALKRLKALGYITLSPDPRDRRTALLRLAPYGAAAMRDSSVLEAARVDRMLAALDAKDRKTALLGLQLLAQAARRTMQQARRAGKAFRANAGKEARR
jgi:MarR family transcriptional regulator, organic hydroperoxide resistance regulator